MTLLTSPDLYPQRLRRVFDPAIFCWKRSSMSWDSFGSYVWSAIHDVPTWGAFRDTKSIFLSVYIYSVLSQL